MKQVTAGEIQNFHRQHNFDLQFIGIISKYLKYFLIMSAERLLCVCYVNILLINLIESQFSFQMFKGILIRFHFIHLLRIIDFLQKTVRRS